MVLIARKVRVRVVTPRLLQLSARLLKQHVDNGLGAQMFKTVFALAFVLTPFAVHADENCLAFVAHEQQIACLARQNESLRATVNDLARTIADLKAGALGNKSQLRLHNKAWAGTNTCLDNASQNMNLIQGWTCNPSDYQVWIVEKVQ
jgi:hypothetical protein